MNIVTSTFAKGRACPFRSAEFVFLSNLCWICISICDTNRPLPERRIIFEYLLAMIREGHLNLKLLTSVTSCSIAQLERVCSRQRFRSCVCVPWARNCLCWTLWMDFALMPFIWFSFLGRWWHQRLLILDFTTDYFSPEKQPSTSRAESSF